MELTRIIHPVGQGGFYTETFVNDKDEEIFNAVYDCGSKTKGPTLIKTRIDEWINEKSEKEIDAVFISHLHDDHINGLDYLLSTYRVKHLFLPKLTPDVIIEAYLYNYKITGRLDNKSNLFIRKVLLKKYNKKTEIIYIDEMNGNNDDNKEPISINNDRRDSINNNNVKTYASGTKFYRSLDVGWKTIEWLYIPYNSPLQSPKKIVNDRTFSSVKDNKGEIDPEKLMDFVKLKGIKGCKKIYERYFGGKHNSYSMTLFSGMKNPCSIKKVDCFPPCKKFNCCWFDRKNNPIERDCCPNFLYTGDFEPNSKKNNKSYVELMKDYLNSLELWKTIRGIQVPHHGSRYNFNNILYEYVCKGYISAGSKNGYGHPNAGTLVNIQKECCLPIVVNEDPKSMQKEVYQIKHRELVCHNFTKNMFVESNVTK